MPSIPPVDEIHGRRVPVTRPRVRAADGSGELPIVSYELFSSTEILGKMAMEKMLAELSARRYPVGLEPVGQLVAEKSSATSKPAVSRRLVAMTEIAENMHEGLLALAVGAGLQVMQALMEADVAVLAGPKGKHNMTRTAVRHGRECGSVTKVAFSVEPSTSASGCLTPSMPIPRATTQQDSAKCTPSIINATRSSPDRSRDSNSASAVSVIATKRRETADLLVDEDRSATCLPTGSSPSG